MVTDPYISVNKLPNNLRGNQVKASEKKPAGALFFSFAKPILFLNIPISTLWFIPESHQLRHIYMLTLYYMTKIWVLVSYRVPSTTADYPGVFLPLLGQILGV